MSCEIGNRESIHTWDSHEACVSLRASTTVALFLRAATSNCFVLALIFVISGILWTNSLLVLVITGPYIFHLVQSSQKIPCSHIFWLNSGQVFCRFCSVFILPTHVSYLCSNQAIFLCTWLLEQLTYFAVFALLLHIISLNFPGVDQSYSLFHPCLFVWMWCDTPVPDTCPTSLW